MLPLIYFVMTIPQLEPGKHSLYNQRYIPICLVTVQLIVMSETQTLGWTVGPAHLPPTRYIVTVQQHPVPHMFIRTACPFTFTVPAFPSCKISAQRHAVHRLTTLHRSHP